MTTASSEPIPATALFTPEAVPAFDAGTEPRAVGVYAASDASMAWGWDSIIGSFVSLLVRSLASQRSQAAATALPSVFGFHVRAAVSRA
jgi:hypothetical protein